MSGGVLDYVVNDSAGVFRYDDQYNLTMELALDVSDHYPVHFILQGNQCITQYTSFCKVTSASLSALCVSTIQVRALLVVGDR